ncbi:DNA-directed DNA polymerase [Ranunculus cassubicifolius]
MSSSRSSRTRELRMKKNQKTPNNNGDIKIQNPEEICEISSSSSPSIEELGEQQIPPQNSFEVNMEESKNTTTMKKKNTKNKNRQHGSEENAVSCVLPTATINRIIRSETATDIRFTHESIFLINKATENFLELFCENVYANVAREKRKAVDYKHLASVVSKCKRYDFLSDFVPEKIKAEDALSERLAGL